MTTSRPSCGREVKGQLLENIDKKLIKRMSLFTTLAYV